jgi:acylphosphatase
MKCYQIRIYGKIHNLGFRFYTMQAAVKRKVYGYVKNSSDGSVFIEAEGEEENLADFIDWCQKGPFFTRIENVTIEEVDLHNHKSFETR